MDQTVNSDDTMAASKMFDGILSQIQLLNFRLQVFPFSAIMSLKKSLAENKSGAPLYKAFVKEEVIHR